MKLNPVLWGLAWLGVLAGCGGGGGGNDVTPPSPLPPTISSVSPALGPASGGTSITVTGTNFRTGATVLVGGAAATAVTVQGSTSLTATTPARSSIGRVDLTVNNNDGTQAATLSGGFEYQVQLVANPGGPYSYDTERNAPMSGLQSTSVPFPIVRYLWNCGQPSGHRVNCTPDTPTPVFRYSKTAISTGPAVVYTVTLVVEDTQGNRSAPATTTVTLRQVY